MMKTFAIILSGSGVYDGTEIHEAVTTMLAIKKHKGNYQLFAPDWNQSDVINHLTGEKMNETRNILVEAARIARGNIKNLKKYKPTDFDGIIFPGGFGAAKNLCTYAYEGVNTSVNPLITNIIIETFKAGKKIGAECISPVMITAVLDGAIVTIGKDPSTISDIETMKGKHIVAKYDDVVYDANYRLYTTPCYMESADILEVAQSAEALVIAMIKD